MRARLSVMFVGALVMVLTSLPSPAAFAQEQVQQRDPNEGEQKHEINELQNRFHQTEDKSKENHLEGKIDSLRDQFDMRLREKHLKDLSDHSQTVIDASNSAIASMARGIKG